jgi:hypothetical protein
MGCEIEDVWSDPGPAEDPRIRARREAVLAQARQTRLRRVAFGLTILGAIVLLGTLGGLAGTFFLWLFGAWFGSQ